MPLDNYVSLQASVLGWLARPGDPLVAPAVPDMIRLFEAEANRRLRVDGAQGTAVLATLPGLPFVPLPADFGGLRTAFVSLNGSISKLAYLPPTDDAWAGLVTQTGRPIWQNAGGGVLELGPAPDATYQISLDYTRGVPALGNFHRTNWLLTRHPDCYLFGALVEAEAYIGHDERIALWLQRREAAFASIEQADRKLRWSGGPLQIRVDGITSPRGFGGGGGSAGAPPAEFPELPGLPGAVLPSEGALFTPSYREVPVRVVRPSSGNTVIMLAGERAIYVADGPLAVLTIRLPPSPSDDMLTEISYENSIDSLSIQDSSGVPVPGGPVNAFGAGSGHEMRFLVQDGTGWVFWK